MPVPFNGAREFTFTQPDGSPIRVRGWGNQDRAVFETMDGFPLAPDAATGALAPTTASVRGTESPHVFETSLPTPRWRERLDADRAALRAIALAPPRRHTVGDYLGLCLLLQFPDLAGQFTQAEIDGFCNRPGYTGFGNHGSVHDYFLDNSAGRLRYTSIVAPYYTARNPRKFYTDPTVPYGKRAQELIAEALAHHKSLGLDFSRLTTDHDGAVYAMNAFYAGREDNEWGHGLWGHTSRLDDPFNLGGGKSAVDYQISAMGDALTLGVFCHENGHMLCTFPDLYGYPPQPGGVGVYCLMCNGCDADPRNPAQVSGYLKYRAGWATSVTRLTAGMAATATAGINQAFLFERTPTEYFLIENRQRTGRDAALTDAGLAIWRVDEQGSNPAPPSSPPGHQHFECALVQADGRLDLETGTNVGDESDLFRRGLNDRFAETTTPASTWGDGSPSGLDLHDIDSAGRQITFKVKART